MNSLHLAIVFRPKEKQLGVELHFENSNDNKNREALVFVQRNIESEVLPSGEKIHFVERSRPTQGWAQAFVRRSDQEPVIELRKWAGNTLIALFELFVPVLNTAQKEGIL